MQQLSIHKLYTQHNSIYQVARLSIFTLSNTSVVGPILLHPVAYARCHAHVQQRSEQAAVGPSMSFTPKSPHPVSRQSPAGLTGASWLQGTSIRTSTACPAAPSPFPLKIMPSRYSDKQNLPAATATLSLSGCRAGWRGPGAPLQPGLYISGAVQQHAGPQGR